VVHISEIPQPGNPKNPHEGQKRGIFRKTRDENTRGERSNLRIVRRSGLFKAIYKNTKTNDPKPIEAKGKNTLRKEKERK